MTEEEYAAQWRASLSRDQATSHSVADRILALMSDGRPRTTGDLTCHLGISRSQAAYHIGRLALAGMVGKEQSPDSSSVIYQKAVQ